MMKSRRNNSWDKITRRIRGELNKNWVEARKVGRDEMEVGGRGEREKERKKEGEERRRRMYKGKERTEEVEEKKSGR